MDLSPSSPPNVIRRSSASPLAKGGPGGPPNPPLARDGRPLAQQERKGSTVSLKVPSRADTFSPDDGYDYKDVGPSPEGSATTEKENAKLASNVPELRLDSKDAMPESDGLENGFEMAKPSRYFQRRVGHRRYIMPDEENNSHVPNGGVHTSGMYDHRRFNQGLKCRKVSTEILIPQAY